MNVPNNLPPLEAMCLNWRPGDAEIRRLFKEAVQARIGSHMTVLEVSRPGCEYDHCGNDRAMISSLNVFHDAMVRLGNRFLSHLRDDLLGGVEDDMKDWFASKVGESLVEVLFAPGIDRMSHEQNLWKARDWDGLLRNGFIPPSEYDEWKKICPVPANSGDQDQWNELVDREDEIKVAEKARTARQREKASKSKLAANFLRGFFGWMEGVLNLKTALLIHGSVRNYDLDEVRKEVKEVCELYWEGISDDGEVWVMSLSRFGIAKPWECEDRALVATANEQLLRDVLDRCHARNKHGVFAGEVDTSCLEEEFLEGLDR